MRVMLGMSGGVDSAVAALLLKERGFEVTGVFMKNWEEQDEDGVCTSAADYEDARAVSEKIGIPYYTVNFAKEYKERVFSHFLSEYSKGRTPNPDILCNTFIKFRAFLDLSRNAGADFLATGHYARLDESTRLLRAKDKSKDQTYFLAGLKKDQLKDVLFPIGALDKLEVRRIAKEHGLINAEKKDSTGICFIGERDFKSFLMRYLPAQPGDIVDASGRVLGRHDGLMYYTLGQRKGLGIGGIRDGGEGSFYVTAKDMQSNRLIVGQGDPVELYSSSLVCETVNYIQGGPPNNEFDCTAKFRYRQPDQPVSVKVKDGGAEVFFHSPQRAVTPGQWAVFYMGEECLGGGAIDIVRK